MDGLWGINGTIAEAANRLVTGKGGGKKKGGKGGGGGGGRSRWMRFEAFCESFQTLYVCQPTREDMFTEYLGGAIHEGCRYVVLFALNCLPSTVCPQLTRGVQPRLLP